LNDGYLTLNKVFHQVGHFAVAHIRRLCNAALKRKQCIHRVGTSERRGVASDWKEIVVNVHCNIEQLKATRLIVETQKMELFLLAL
jgi:hypothetical protein